MRCTRPVLLMLFVLSLSGTAGPLPASESPGLSVSLTATPIPSDPDRYLCKYVIKNTVNDEIIVSNQTSIVKGGFGSFRGGASGYSWIIATKINKPGANVAYTVNVYKGSALMAVQKGFFSLLPVAGSVGPKILQGGSIVSAE